MRVQSPYRSAGPGAQRPNYLRTSSQSIDSLGPICFNHTPDTRCGIARSLAVIVLGKASVLAGILSEYLRKAVL